MKQAKRTLVLSAIVLLLSVAMLAGATFAWFTDSVTNSGNKIEAGNLEVDLLQKTSTLSAAQQEEIASAEIPPLTDGDFTDISDLTSPVFDYSLWEPGYSTGAVFKVKNSGTLAFKFGFAFASLEVTQNLGDVLIVSVNGEDKGTLTEFATGTPFFSGILGSGMTSAALEIVIRMNTDAGNDYQGATAKFDLVLKAVQTSLEEDGFGNADYDAAASEGWVDAPKADSVVVPVTPGEDTTIVNPDYPAKAEIPAAALADGATSLTFSIIETESVPEGITVSAGQEAMPFDIKVDGLKADNTAPVAVSLFVGKHLLDVSVYHHDVLLTAETDNFAYDPETGIVSFTTTSFSPFTVKFHAFAGGDGSPENPYLISDARHLSNVSSVLNKNFKLIDNISLQGMNWSPLGNNLDDSTCFSGVFDGNGHTISEVNVTSKQSAAWDGFKNSYNYAGLFGTVTGTVKNLVLQNCSVSVSDADLARRGDVYAGVLAGANFGTVKNVTVSDSSVSATAWLIASAGGIVGSNVGTVDTCKAERVIVSALSEGWTANAGGIAGASGDRLYWNLSASVQNNTALSCAISSEVTGAAKKSDIDYPSATTYFGRVYCGGIGGLAVNTTSTGNTADDSNVRTAKSYATGSYILFNNRLWGYGASA